MARCRMCPKMGWPRWQKYHAEESVSRANFGWIPSCHQFLNVVTLLRGVSLAALSTEVVLLEHRGEHVEAPARYALNTCSGDGVFADSWRSAATHRRWCTGSLFLVVVFENARRDKLEHCFVMASVMKHFQACSVALKWNDLSTCSVWCLQK